MANNNALSMVALGLAAAGGGGSSYSAGDGINITNNEIKVRLEEGHGLNFASGVIKSATFSGASASSAGTDGMVPAPLSGDTNKYLKSDGTWAQMGEPTDFVKSVSVEAPGSGVHGTATFTKVVDGQQSTTSLTYNAVEANYPGSPTGTLTSLNIDGTEYAVQDTTYSAGTNITIDANNVISATGGSSSGAVRYDEAQSLTEAQFNQAMSNLQLGCAKTTRSQECFDLDIAAGSWGTNTTYYFIAPAASEYIPTSGSITTTEFTFEYTIDGVSSGEIHPTSGNYNSSYYAMNFSRPSSMASGPYIMSIRIARDGTSNTSYLLVTDSMSSKSFVGTLNWSHTDYTTIDDNLVPQALKTDSNNIYCIYTDNSITRNIEIGKKSAGSASLISEGRGNICIGYSTCVDGYQYTNNVLLGTSTLFSCATGSQYNKSYNTVLNGQSNSILGWSNYSTIIGGRGNETFASHQFATGLYNKACGTNTTVIGKYNQHWTKWAASTEYAVGDKVLYLEYGSGNHVAMVCTTAHTSSSSLQRDYWKILGYTNTEYDYAFIVGNGTDTSTRSNAFTLDWNGNGVFAGTVTPSGADYCEYFEWQDGNPDNEDRMGYIVALDGNNIVLANGSDILGITTATKAVIGDSQEMNWSGKYERDAWGRIIYEDTEVVHPAVTDPETGEVIIPEWTEIVKAPKISPEYDPTREYKPRSKRKEWYPVGLLGKILVRDDGTLAVGDYVTANNGIAVKSEVSTNIKVLERTGDNVVRVLFK